MKVLAYLYIGPGRGSYMFDHVFMPDAAMPKDDKAFALRSTKAVQHFWPGEWAGRALSLREFTGKVDVYGSNWMVQWLLDAHVNDTAKFIEDLAVCESVADLCAKSQPFTVKAERKL